MCRSRCRLNSPPAIALTILPFLTNIVLKVVSSLLAGKTQKLTLEAMLSRYKPRGVAQLLSSEQLSVLQETITQSTSDITIGATLAGSVAAALIIALKSAQPWFWWAFIASIVVAFAIWIWVYTRESLSESGWLSLSLGWWVLMTTCSFDGVLAALSFVAGSAT
jgi:hypothetical protein